MAPLACQKTPHSKRESPLFSHQEIAFRGVPHRPGVKIKTAEQVRRRRTMIQSTLTTASVFGHCGEEIQCLLRQSRLYNPCTQRLLEQAGITAGLKVLAVGSGAGDVTLLAGNLVGKRGMVVGVEHDLALLEIARARTGAAGLTQVSFVA